MKAKMFKVWQIIDGYFSCWNKPLLDSESAPRNYLVVQHLLKLTFSISKNG